MTERQDAQFAVRAAVIDALSALAELSAITGGEARVWEYVDTDAPLPYTQVLPDDTADWSFSEIAGDEHTFTVHAWSGAKGAQEADQMLQIAKERLDRARDLDLTPFGHRLVNIVFLTKGVVRDADGLSYHGFSRYRATTQEV